MEKDKGLDSILAAVVSLASLSCLSMKESSRDFTDSGLFGESDRNFWIWRTMDSSPYSLDVRVLLGVMGFGGFL